MDRLSAPGYDLFKLVVALILTAILMILLLRGCNPVPPAPVLPDTPETPETEAPDTEIPVLVPTTEEPTEEPAEEPTDELGPTPSVTASLQEPSAPITDTPAPPSFTDTPALAPVTDTPAPPPGTDTPTPALITDTPAPPPVTDTPTPVPVTDTPAPPPGADASTPTATPGPQPAPDTACNTSMPSRLRVGQNARTLVNLNMRTGPDIQASIIQTNRARTQVEIIGGPQCNPQGERAYLWWQVRLANGKEGWSAETPLIHKSYFLEALP